MAADQPKRPRGTIRERGGVFQVRVYLGLDPVTGERVDLTGTATSEREAQKMLTRFLAEKGEGVHHIAVATPNFHDVVAEQTRRGVTLPLSGSFTGVEVAYLPTDRDLGVILEIFSGMPDANHESDAAEGA